MKSQGQLKWRNSASLTFNFKFQVDPLVLHKHITYHKSTTIHRPLSPHNLPRTMGTGLWDRLQQGTSNTSNPAPNIVTKRDERLMRRRREREERHNKSTNAPMNTHTLPENSRERSYIHKRNRRLQQRTIPDQTTHQILNQNGLEQPNVEQHLKVKLPEGMQKIASRKPWMDADSRADPDPDPGQDTSLRNIPEPLSVDHQAGQEEARREARQEVRMPPNQIDQFSGVESPFGKVEPVNVGRDAKARVEFELKPQLQAGSVQGITDYDQEEDRKRQYREELERQMAEQRSRKDEIPIKPYLLEAKSLAEMHRKGLSKEDELRMEMEGLAASLAGANSSSHPSAGFLNMHTVDRGQALREKEAQQRTYAMALQEQIQQKSAAQMNYSNPGAGQMHWSGKPVDVDQGLEKRLRQQEYARELNNQIDQKRSLEWQSGRSHGQFPDAHQMFQQREVLQPQEFPMTNVMAEKEARARKLEAQAKYRLELLQQQAQKVALQKQTEKDGNKNTAACYVEPAPMDRFPPQVGGPRVELPFAFPEATQNNQRALVTDAFVKKAGDDGANTRFIRSVTNPFTEAESLERKQKQQQQFAELSMQVEQVRKRKAEEKAKREEEERRELERIEEERKVMQEAFEREEKRKKVEQQKKDLQDQILLKQAQAETQRKKELEEEAKDEARIQRERAEIQQDSQPKQPVIQASPSLRPVSPPKPRSEADAAPRSPIPMPVSSPTLAKNVEAQKEELTRLRNQADNERRRHQLIVEQVEELQSRLDHYEKNIAPLPQGQPWNSLEKYSNAFLGSERPPQLPFVQEIWGTVTYDSDDEQGDERKARSSQVDDHDHSLVCDTKFVFPDGRTLTESVYLEDSELSAAKGNPRSREPISAKTNQVAKSERYRTKSKKRSSAISPCPSSSEHLSKLELNADNDSEHSESALTGESTEEDSWSIDTNEIHLLNERRHKVLSQVNSDRLTNPDQLDLLLKQFDEEKGTSADKKSRSAKRSSLEKLGGSTRWLSVSKCKNLAVS